MVHVTIYYQSWTDITGQGSSSSILICFTFCRFPGNGRLKSCLLCVTSFAQSNIDRIFSRFNVFLTDVHLKSAGLKCLEHTTVSVVFYLIGNHLEVYFHIQITKYILSCDQFSSSTNFYQYIATSFYQHIKL